MARSQMSSMAWPGITIEVARDLVEVPAGVEPDPKWRFIDGSGHLHAWVGKRGLPTLKRFVDKEAEEGIGPDGDEWYSPEESHYECEVCFRAARGQGGGEHIEPGYRKTPPRLIDGGPVSYIATIVQGRSTWTVALTEEEFRALQWATHAMAVDMVEKGGKQPLNTVISSH